MKKELIVFGMVVALIIGFVENCHAFGNVNTNFNYNTDSNDKKIKDSGNIGSFNKSTKNYKSNNKTIKKWDSHDKAYKDSNDKAIGSYNQNDQKWDLNTTNTTTTTTTLTDSFKNNTYTDDFSQNKRMASHNIGGSVTKSIIGDFKQDIAGDSSVMFGDVTMITPVTSATVASKR